MFAATYPERTRSIVLLACTPCSAGKPNWQLGSRRGDFKKWLHETEAQRGKIEDLEPHSSEMARDPLRSGLFNRLLLHIASQFSMVTISRVN
jgi:pimeloyl-ACP methyl ester carboxylesterase